MARFRGTSHVPERSGIGATAPRDTSQNTRP
jgi:hypothetical protein